MGEVLEAAEDRNQVLHAVARNRCTTCGTATLFQHPRTGKFVDRSQEFIQELTEKVLNLWERGGGVAEEVASLVNKRIILAAMLLADDTGETVVPETVHPHVAQHTCGTCNGDGRATASVTVHLGGVEIPPTGHARALLDDMNWPHASS